MAAACVRVRQAPLVQTQIHLQHSQHRLSQTEQPDQINLHSQIHSTKFTITKRLATNMQSVQQAPFLSGIPGLEVEKTRAGACWSIQNCNTCTNSKHGCGWCPYSSTCVPTSNLLKPVTNTDVCPLRAERYELRTNALGCGCSTTTVLSIIVTIFATIAALALLYGLAMAIFWFNKIFGSGTWNGTELEVEDDGTRKERQWSRSNAVTSYVRTTVLKATKESEQEQVTERSRLMG